MPLVPARPLLTLLIITAIPNMFVAQPCPIGGAFAFADSEPEASLFESGHARLANLNADDVFDLADIAAFVTSFKIGCP